MNYQDEYRRKLISAEDAAVLVKSEMWIDYGYGLGFPPLIDESLAQRASELERVKVRAALSPYEPRILKADPEQQHFIYNSWHLSSSERRYHAQGCCSYIPSSLVEIPGIYRELLKDNVDIALIEVTPMNKHGYFNFGAFIGYQKAVCDVARTVVVEVNESQPWLHGGYDESIHISQWPLPQDEKIDEEAEKKGDLIAAVMGEIRRDKAESKMPLNASIQKLTIYSADKEKSQVLNQAEEDLVGTCKLEKMEVVMDKGAGREVQGYPDVHFTVEY